MIYTNNFETMMKATDRILWGALEYRMEYLYLSRKYKEAKKSGDNNLAKDLFPSLEYVRGHLIGVRDTLEEFTGEDYEVKSIKDDNGNILEQSITFKGKEYTVSERLRFLRKGVSTLRSYRGNAEALGVSETSLITSIVDLSEKLERLEKDINYLKNGIDKQ